MPRRPFDRHLPGGITNSGLILGELTTTSSPQAMSNSAATAPAAASPIPAPCTVNADGIYVYNVTSFLGAISNSGTISALGNEGDRGIFVTGVGQFGGIASAGITISGLTVLNRATSIGIRRQKCHELQRRRRQTPPAARSRYRTASRTLPSSASRPSPATSPTAARFRRRGRRPPTASKSAISPSSAPPAPVAGSSIPARFRRATAL